QLAFLDNGATDANPVRQIDRDPNGNPILIPNPPAGGDLLQMGVPKDNTGQPIKGRDGNPLVLRSRDGYYKEYDSLVQAETLQFIKRNAEAARDKDFTDRLKGPKGLHARLQYEAVKLERLKDEYSEIRPLWLNTKVEYQNLEDLRRRLNVRFDELIK